MTAERRLENPDSSRRREEALISWSADVPSLRHGSTRVINAAMATSTRCAAVAAGDGDDPLSTPMTRYRAERSTPQGGTRGCVV
jgi:hypothetical protein